MKIKETKVSYLKSVNIGVRAYMLQLSKSGFDADIEELADECSTYNVCEITGDRDTNPFYYNEGLSAFCKTVKKNNPYTKIIIHSDGYIQPTGFNSITDLVHVVHVKLKRSGVDYKLRVNENALRNLGKQDSMFVFDIIDDEEIDEINMLLLETDVNKNKVFVKPYGDDNELEKNFYLLMHNGFNVYIEYGGEWFGNN